MNSPAKPVSYTPANHPLRGIPVDPPIALRGVADALARMTAQLDLTVRKEPK